MKRVKVIIIGVVVFGGVVSILLNNRARINAKSQSDFLSAYPVTVATVQKRQLSEDFSLVGTITASSDVAIVSETQGRVTAVLANVGDFRRAGSPLIRVDDELKRAEYEKAEANYQRAKRDMERFKSLREQHAATEVQSENAWQSYKVAEAQYILARKQYRDTKITTPISGVVTSRNVDVGTMVQDRMVVANVVDISTLKVKLNVAESDAFKLKAGDRVQVTTDVYPGVSFDGTISTISAKADEGHTYPVEVTLPNSREHPLKAGMFGRVSFTAVDLRPALAIPRGALVGSTKQPQVFIVRDGIARIRDIVAGEETGTDLAVLSGLAEGETVVVNGQNNLKDSVAVEILQ